MKISIKLSILAMALTFGGMTTSEASTIREKKLDSLAIGMSKVQAISTLGQPKMVYEGGNLLEYKVRKHRPLRRFILPWLFIGFFAVFFTSHSKYTYWLRFKDDKLVAFGKPGSVI